MKKEYRSFADAQEAVPIAAEQGIERSPALSPDGTHLVFSWSGELGETPNLYVQNLDGTGRVRLTSDQTPDRSPAWSPDGRTIAFIRAGEVFSIPAIGGPQRTITTAIGDGLSWSANSQELAVSDREAMDGSLSVYLVSTETGKRRRLTSPALAKSQDIWPAFTSRGDYVAFVRRTTTTDDQPLEANQREWQSRDVPCTDWRGLQTEAFFWLPPGGRLPACFSSRPTRATSHGWSG